MTIRLIGALLIILGCGSVGFLIVNNIKYEMFALKSFAIAMEYMVCELKYRMTPLPELCRITSMATKGVVSKLFRELSDELEAQVSPNVSLCMNSVLYRHRDLPASIFSLCENLGARLGLFDLEGQIQVLSSLQEDANKTLKMCQEGQNVRLRGYKTIALCAGAAIVILLI